MAANTYTTYGVADGPSSDGLAHVIMQGGMVGPGGGEAMEEVLSAERFESGEVLLEMEPEPGTVEVYRTSVSEANRLEDSEFWVEGQTLTVEALQDDPAVDLSWQTAVEMELGDPDFDDGAAALLGEPSSVTVTEGGSPVTHDLEDGLLLVPGMGEPDGFVRFEYEHEVELTLLYGTSILPDAPEAVTVVGRDLSAGTETPVTAILDGNLITIQAGYDEYGVSYAATVVEEWSLSDQVEEVPDPDSEDGGSGDYEPDEIVVGHLLQWEPDAVTSCTVDGAAATYTLTGQVVVADAPAWTPRTLEVSYSLDVTDRVPSSKFRTGPYTLPSLPSGSVTAAVGGSPVACTLSELELSIPSLMEAVTEYVVRYDGMTQSQSVEMPCVPAVEDGESVIVTVVNGSPTVTGKVGEGDSLQTYVGDAVSMASDASDAADAAQAVAEAVNQHFWADGSGVHVTEVTQEEWLDPADPNYQSGANQLSNSAGILLRDGLTNFAQLTPGETAFYDGQGNTSDNVVASFGISGGFIGQQSAGSYAAIDSDSFDVYHGGVEVAHLGYGEGTDSGGAAANAPYFTLGKRYGADDGAYRTTRTYDVGARVTYGGDAYICKVAITTPEAWDASKWQPLIGNYSLVAGNGGAASGEGAIALGQGIAIGRNSAALGLGTTATRTGSLVAGRYNNEDAAINYLFALGNGTDNVNRSDAFTVDVSGNAWAAGNVIATNLGRIGYASDLDDLVTPGVYYCSTASTNGPIASTAGQCVVAASSSRANVVQLYTTYGNAPAIYARRLYSGTWSTWQALGDTVAEDMPTLSNASATTFAVRRKNGIATIYVRELAISTALASGSAVSIATLPAGYRPAYTTGVPLTSTTANAARGVWLYITSGGAVSIYNRSGNSLATSSNLYGTGTYVM